MTSPTAHLKGYELDPQLPLWLQAQSLETEIEAADVFQVAAQRDLDAGDIRAHARLAALGVHVRQLREALQRIEIGEQRH